MLAATEDQADEIFLDGVRLASPSCAILIVNNGVLRRLMITRLPAETMNGHLRAGSAQAPLLAARPVEDFAQIYVDLSAAEQVRLLRFLVATCGPVFRVARDRPMAALVLRLACQVEDRAGQAGAVAYPLSRQGTPALSMWHVPGEPAPGLWHLLSANGAQRVAAPLGGVLMLEGRHATSSTGFLLPPPGPDGAARAPLRLAEAPKSLPGLIEGGIAAAPAELALARALSRRIAARPEDPLAAQLLRDRRLLTRPAQARRLEDPARPIGGALELAVSDCGGGVCISGWLRDPFGIASGGLALRDLMTGRTLAIAPQTLYRVARPDLAVQLAKAVHGDGGAKPGFVAHLPDAESLAGGPVAQWGLDLRLASGEAVQLTAPIGLLPAVQARALVLRAVHPEAVSPPILDECLTPAVARLQRAALAILGPPETILIGEQLARPRVAIVIPLYRNLRFLRFQIAAFARDAGLLAAAQIILVLDSPEQREEVEHLLRGLHAIYALPLTLLIMSANAG